MSTKPTKGANIKALFIGDKSENGKVYKDILSGLIDEHLGWRLNYMPQDRPAISFEDQADESYKKTIRKTKDVLAELSRIMRLYSVPFHSAGRYQSHMLSETLMPAILAYNFAMLWNANNCVFELSPATSMLEEEVGMDLSRLLGFGEKGWGHITSGGTAANMEGIWYARNIKSLPLAIKEVEPELVKGKSEWELLNMSVDESLDLWEKVKVENRDAVKNRTARSGKNIQKLGKWIVPQTKHYSWPKAADIVGIGLDNVVPVPVDDHYTLDMEKLEKTIRDLVSKKIPVLGMVAIIGTTEEGQVDPIDKIVALRKKLNKELGINFYIHIDSAYGGYGRTLFIDPETHEFAATYERLLELHDEYNVFGDWDGKISETVYNAYKATGEVDSITIDPHKIGYIPYEAGGVALRDRRMRDVISYFATYVFEKGSKIPVVLGAYMMEGSKAGASAAAVWAAHHVLPLDISGYGKLMGATVAGAHFLKDFLDGRTYYVNDKEYKIEMVYEPDFNMIDYVIVEKGNKDLAKLNEMQSKFYDLSCFASGSCFNNEWIISHTDFAVPEYGDSPIGFVCGKLGFSKEEWDRVGKITVLRSTIMSPYTGDKKLFDEYAESIDKVIEKRIRKIVLNLE